MVSSWPSRPVARSCWLGAPGDRRPQAPLPAAYDDAGVAVVDAEAVVVGGHQQRAAGVPRRPDRLAGLLAEPALDLPVPVLDAVGTLAVGAQQALPVERRQRGVDVTGLGRTHQVASACASSSSRIRGRRVGVASTNSTCSSPARRSSTARSASPARTASASERIGGAEPVGGAQGGDPYVGARTQALDQVGQHRAGLDRGQLVGVADQEQPGVGTHRLEQAGHHRERHHRGLVDHDDVVRVAGCRGGGGTGPRCRAGRRGAGAASPPAGPVSRARSDSGNRATSSSTACWSRAAALPVGAASAIRGAGRAGAAACSTSSASSAATVVVLPVPGPPVRTVVLCDSAIRAAARCSS